jgi:hypothetical protein
VPLLGLAAAAAVTLTVALGYFMRSPSAPAPSVASAPTQTTPAPQPVPPQPSPTPAPTSFVAITLGVPTRSLAQPPVLTLPQQTDEARVTLRLAPDEFTRYTVDLRELSSRTIVWHADDQPAVDQAGDRVLLCSVPAADLHAGRFAFELHGSAPRRSNVLGSYPITIER